MRVTAVEVVGKQPPVVAGIFYIDQNGNDSNDGSQFKPCKTLSHANKLMKPGDTVLINPGKYPINTKLSIQTSGTKDRPIIIRGNGENVVLDCTKCSDGNAFEIYFCQLHQH